MIERINGAFDRIDDFLAVQSGASFPELVEAINRLQTAVGLDDEGRVAIRDRLESLDQLDHAGGVLLGLVVGLFAADMTGTPS